jgi:AcrR family transcriptional regulator
MNAAPATTFQRIQSAALQTFAEHGFEATGIRQIAERAEIPTSLLYHYSRSKAELLRLLVEEGLRRLAEADRLAIAQAATPEGRLVALAAAHVFVHAENRQMAGLLDTELRVLTAGDRAGVLALRDDIDDLWREVLREGIAEGVFNVPDAGVARLALIRMCNGVATWFSPRGRLDVMTLAGHFGDLALAATQARRRGQAVRVAGLEGLRLDVIQQIVHDTHAGMPGSTPDPDAGLADGTGPHRRRRIP